MCNLIGSKIVEIKNEIQFQSYIMLETETKETYIITISNSKKFIIVKAEEDKN